MIFLIQFGGAGIKLIISSAQFQELFMGSLLYDLAMFQHDDQVRISNGGQPVGYHKSSPVLHKPVHAAFDVLFGPGVD